MTAYRFFGV